VELITPEWPWSRLDVGVTFMLDAHAPACITLCLDILGGMEGVVQLTTGTLPYACSR